jgi:colicin import membrane protein
LIKNKEKTELEKAKFEKDKKRGKLSPNDELKHQEKIDKLQKNNTELQNKLEKAQIKLDKIR